MTSRMIWETLTTRQRRTPFDIRFDIPGLLCSGKPRQLRKSSSP